MNGENAGNRLYYVAVWRSILVGWLHWPPDRFGRWVARWGLDLDDRGDGWFYHEDELYWILPLLVPEELALRLQRQRTQRMFNDLAALEFEELQPAIMGGAQKVDWGTRAYDWDGAKQRVEAVLARYGTALPPVEHVTSFERRVLAGGVSDTGSAADCRPR